MYSPGSTAQAKATIGGAMIRASGADYFNPMKRRGILIAANPGLDQ